jgi:hypothetical protein
MSTKPVTSCSSHLNPDPDKVAYYNVTIVAKT